MSEYTETLLSDDHIEHLKLDTEIGCGNFIDRLYDIHPKKDVDFIHLQKPVKVPGGIEYRALSMDSLMIARERLAAWYLSIGIGVGDLVAICVSDGISPFLHYVSLSSVGAAACILNPKMPLDMAVIYLQENGLELVVVDDEVLEYSETASGLVSDRFRDITVINSSEACFDETGDMPGWWPFAPSDDTLVMLSHTSGTTGVSKAVQFEHRQFFMGKRARLGRFAESSDERFLSALPQSHSSAISHLETAVLNGITTYVLSDCVGPEVKRAIREFEPTTVAGFPQTYTSLVHMGVMDNEFTSVRRWFSMGDAMHRVHIKEVIRTSPTSRFIDSFGSSELGMAVFKKVSTAEAITPSRCIGRPVDIASCRILDSLGNDCEKGSIGLLAIRSPTITPGYWMRDELTASSWMKGYFLTGDVGYVEDDEYYLVDRACDVLEIGEARYYTLLIEERLQELKGVTDAIVVGVEEGQTPIVCVTVLCGSFSMEREALLAQVVKDVRMQINADPLIPFNVVVFLTTDPSTLPAGATGKALKRKLREAASSAYRGDTGNPFIRTMSHMTIDLGVASSCETA